MTDTNSFPPPVRLRIRPIEDGLHEVMINNTNIGILATRVSVDILPESMPTVTVTLLVDEVDVELDALLKVYTEPVE